MKKHLSIRKIIMYMAIIIAVIIGIMVIMPAHTEPIVNSNGEVISGSIATMEKIKLGGVDQWIVIRPILVLPRWLMF